MQFTTHQMLLRGVQPAPLLAAFTRCFERATKTTDLAMQQFWDQFVAAHKAIRKPPQELEAA